MDKSQTLLRIKEQQRWWADARNVQRDGDSVVALDANLYQPLNPKTRSQYERGDGDELGRDGQRGKMFSLRSSSALVCNIFDYWQGRPLAPVLSALQIAEEVDDLAFEQKIQHGIEGQPSEPRCGIVPPQLEMENAFVR